MSIRMRGTGGEVRVGGVVAARLRNWSLEGDVVQAYGDVDEFWMAEEGPRSLRLNIGQSVYVWRDVSVAGTDPITITVSGSPDIRG